MLTRGTLRRCIPPERAAATAIVLRVSGGRSILGGLSGEGRTGAIDAWARLAPSFTIELHQSRLEGGHYLRT